MLSLAIAFGFGFRSESVLAQGRQIPSLSYKLVFPSLWDGDYQVALRGFQEECRMAIKTTQGFWIDSICYQTMVGECYFRTGDLGRALDCYTAAVRLYLAFPDWMRCVNFPAIRPLNAQRATPWGVSTRASQLGQYLPGTNLQGQVDNTNAITQGGVLQMPVLVPMDATEIVRSTVLAIRRRGELLGPVTKYDSVNNDLIAALSQRPGPPNHWSQVWIDVELACALINAGKLDAARPLLERSQVAAGQFDHPLTATVLLQLGKLEMAAGNYLGASRAFLEASYSAYNYADVDVIKEALHYGAVTHLAGGNREVYPPLAAATAWAKVNHKRSLAVSAPVLTAESYATFEQTRDATVALNEAQASIGRTAVAASRLQARLNLVRGLTFFQDGKIAPGDKVVEQAIEYMRRGSFWLFQIAHADANLIASQITSRTAMELFNLLLRDPQPVNWTLDPLESLAVLMVPHTPAFEHWFLVALNRTDHDAALEISDRTRRHRYFSTLAYGGRLESLRWILEAPDAALPPNAILQRQELLAHHPRYTDLSKRAAEIRGQIAKMPLVAKDQEMAKTQSRLFADLAALCANQEVILREIAVRHEAAAMVFPPMRGIKEIQKALPKGTAMLAFFAAGGNLYAFLLNQDKYGMWTVKDTKLAAKRLQGLLREMGHWEQNHELTLNDLTNTEWKAAARQLLEDLLAGSNADFSKRFPELVIVPDGFLWYVPFETLQVNVDNRSAPLIARFRIRYAPTLSLSVPDKRGWVTEADTAVMLGRLYPRDPDAVAQSGVRRFGEGSAPLFRHRQKPSAGSVVPVPAADGPADRAGRHRISRSEHSLLLGSDPIRREPSRQYHQRLARSALGWATNDRPSRLSHPRGIVLQAEHSFSRN